MASGFRLGWAAALGLTGCASVPPLDNPMLINKTAEPVENPVIVFPGIPNGESYRKVREKCLNVLTSYKFEILTADSRDGLIITKPRISPGYEQVWKGANPDPRERLLATLQTTRQIVTIKIDTGERGGYRVQVTVEKEMEDLAKPSRQRIGAVFQETPTVAREIEVVGPVAPSTTSSWFPVGRDYACEQLLLQRIRDCR